MPPIARQAPLDVLAVKLTVVDPAELDAVTGLIDCSVGALSVTVNRKLCLVISAPSDTVAVIRTVPTKAVLGVRVTTPALLTTADTAAVCPVLGVEQGTECYRHCPSPRTSSRAACVKSATGAGARVVARETPFQA